MPTSAMRASHLDIPVLPAVRTRALALLADADCSIRDLATIVSADPALTASVLRAANSALSGTRHRFQTAQEAMVRIGLGPTRRIVTGSMIGETFGKFDRAGIRAEELWQHLIVVALLAEAGDPSIEPRGLAFTAGLLHDIGRLAMAVADPPRYAEVVASAASGLDPGIAEFRLFGTHHSALGYRVGQQWQLPQEVLQAVLDHHRGRLSAVSATVFRARRISALLGYGDGIVPAEEAEGELDADDAEVVKRLRGPKELRARVEWYRDAIQGSV